MTGSVILDVIIGLVFLYLLYALFATIIQEIIATQFGFRAKILERAIIRMLEDGKSSEITSGKNTNDNKSEVMNWIERLRGISILFSRTNKQLKSNMTVAKAFYDHPLIKYLAEDKWYSKPAYITSQNFSKVVIDLFRGATTTPQNSTSEINSAVTNGTIQNFSVKDPKSISVNDETASFITSLWYEAQGDVSKFRTLLENWFDDTMERATGWYKRHTQFILFFIGFILAMAFNVNTIEIAGKLSRDPKLREQLVKNASSYIKAHPNTPEAQHEATKLMQKADSLFNNDIANTNKLLATGWPEYKYNRYLAFFQESWQTLFWHSITNRCSYFFSFFLLNLIGWAITAIAISLGAPFWFDMLNKLMKLRGSVASDTEANNKTSGTPSSQPSTIIVNTNTGGEAVG